MGAAAESEARIYQAGEARLASMESLRALAALAVLVAHVFGVAYLWRPAISDGLLHRTILGGGFAVYLFFALSGYLLYLPFARRDFAARIRLIARRSFARAGFVLAVLALAGLAMRFALVLHPAHHDPRWEYSLLTTFVFFVSGLALAPRSRELERRASRSTGRTGRCLDWRPLALLGTASYSLYLWHLPIVQQVAGAGWSPTGFLPLLAILVPICIVAALVSYAAIEEPFLRLRRSWSGRSRPAPAPVEVPAVVVTPAVEVI